ncbi:short-chain dehydrogenase/reductase [Brenneria roseae subsp. roseae]|uniref:SDR family oxidoreductase n=1 Tax=Brenneria roseae TaxID=1509241 RepID=UPI000D620838|nr:SDR family oxidoreductase [Brenneria roseae]PWC17091.1 short-chain dehydrogenase/reductase [Brenneria roseae subsp. roseae]
MTQKIWFITGTSRGFGRIWAEAALKRGDKVVATARRLETLNPFVETYGEAVLPLQLDVTDRQAAFAAINRAKEHFGRLDVVINNAGFGLSGAIEEVSEADARVQIETNVFGALWVTQAALPIMREQKGGHILSVSSIGGIVTFPTLGLYHASKWALEGMMDALSQEVGDLGIKVTLIEPGGYATDFVDPSSMKFSPSLEVYDEVRKQLAASFLPETVGNPQATAQAILQVVDAPEPPLRIFLGSYPLPLARQRYEERLASWEKWAEVSNSAQGKLA